MECQFKIPADHPGRGARKSEVLVSVPGLCRLHGIAEFATQLEEVGEGCKSTSALAHGSLKGQEACPLPGLST